MLYVPTYDDPSYCTFTSTQGTTSGGGYEQVSISASDYSSSARKNLCASTATVAARFLDAAGLR